MAAYDFRAASPAIQYILREHGAFYWAPSFGGDIICIGCDGERLRISAVAIREVEKLLAPRAEADALTETCEGV